MIKSELTQNINNGNWIYQVEIDKEDIEENLQMIKEHGRTTNKYHREIYEIERKEMTTFDIHESNEIYLMHKIENTFMKNLQEQLDSNFINHIGSPLNWARIDSYTSAEKIYENIIKESEQLMEKINKIRKSFSLDTEKKNEFKS